MRKPIALLLILMMVLTLTAFSFADNGNPMKDKDPSKVDAYVIDNELFITVWLDAELEDVLEGLTADVIEEDEVKASTGEYELVKVFGTRMVKYTFEPIDLTPLDDEFEIEVVVDLDDADDLVLTKKIDLEDLDDEDEVDENDDDEDDEEEMDDDMYPAAPAVANKLLKDAGIPNRVGGENLIALVAAEMDMEEAFGGVDKEDEEEYEEAVDAFLIDALTKIFEDADVDVDGDTLSEFADELEALTKPVMKPEMKPEADKGKPAFVDDANDDDDNEKNENPGKGNKK